MKSIIVDESISEQLHSQITRITAVVIGHVSAFIHFVDHHPSLHLHRLIIRLIAHHSIIMLLLQSVESTIYALGVIPLPIGEAAGTFTSNVRDDRTD
jgi:nucleoside recognition membrane protein YjiH